MVKLVRILEKISDLFGGKLQGILVFGLMVMVMAEVLARYLLNAPLSIAEELGGYILVSVTFMGLGYTWKEKGHVRVELLVNLLPESIRARLRFLTLILAAAFCFPMIAGSWSMLQDSLLFEARSGSWLRTPLVYPQSVLLIGSVLLLIQFAAEIIKAVNRLKDRPERDKGD
ncbi:MAG: TRAP transporter small permease [Desulfobacterales bacterium]|nr:TRAP transporter small permease [Desulfobacterales bacterium]